MDEETRQRLVNLFKAYGQQVLEPGFELREPGPRAYHPMAPCACKGLDALLRLSQKQSLADPHSGSRM